MSNLVNNYSTTIVTIFKDVVSRYENNKCIIKQAEDELNDLEHEIELSNPKNARDGYKIYKEIRDIRIRRRTAKEENELLQELYDYITSQNGRGFKSAIQKIQGHSVKLRETQEHRVYVPRQRTDLTITNKTCTAYRPFENIFNNIK